MGRAPRAAQRRHNLKPHAERRRLAIRLRRRLARVEWHQLSLVLATTAGVILLGHIWRETSDPIEVVWTVLGGDGLVYAVDIWRRRFDQRVFLASRPHTDPQLVDQIQAHVVLRGAGAMIQFLILISGLVSMITPASIRASVRASDIVVALCIVGMGAVATFASWYAEHTARRQTDRAIALLRERARRQRERRALEANPPPEGASS